MAMPFFSSSSAESNLTTAKTFLSAAASFAATVMIIRSVANDLVPGELRDYALAGIHRVLSRFSSTVTMVIDEFDGLSNNEIYEAAETYLGAKISPSAQRLKVAKHDTENDFTLTMERGGSVTDTFNGVSFEWILICRQVESSGSFHSARDINSTLRSELRSLELTFHKKHRAMVLNTYLPHVLKEAKSMKQEAKSLRIFTVDYQNMYGNASDAWVGTNLDHPATFETVSLDEGMKELVMKDLERFVRRKEFYRKVGKAWKRGYLLYGPPGTGKSSLIAAMANYLHFDVYDLELTELQYNSELRRLLIGMANRSILVVEDIDCTIEFKDRMAESTAATGRNDKQVTLSGLLNFIDGLWSSCGDERIIIFTTNHKDKLDPALLRPGRMDVHIHMSYCTPYGFRQLASTYLGITEHTLFGEIEDAIQTTKVTPAEVAEQLLKSSDIETTLKELIDFLRKKKQDQALEDEKKERDAKDEEEQQKQRQHDGGNGKEVTHKEDDS
ncbi:protein HYPER-SENSITIVITY-RELATED 4-like [Arachis stenosperma]|uniref:protein HYPER-SENSITIVITY-RELATED 4-like n=1 Tax=Arachis stenosperma TaxID=217475 RepID=UPI0025ACF0BD|nr:protein HYPER-SENSITIVITY-RELATED 4-like [Arachis stenosperma]